MKYHKCSLMEMAKKNFDDDAFGLAVDSIWFSEKYQCWAMGNGEYTSYPIICCPFCGKKLLKIIDERSR